MPNVQRPALRRGHRRALLHQFRPVPRSTSRPRSTRARATARSRSTSRSGRRSDGRDATAVRRRTDDGRDRTRPLWQRILKWLGDRDRSASSCCCCWSSVRHQHRSGPALRRRPDRRLHDRVRAQHQGRADRRVALRPDGAGRPARQRSQGRVPDRAEARGRLAPVRVRQQPCRRAIAGGAARHAAAQPGAEADAERSQRAAAARSRYRHRPAEGRPASCSPSR